MIVLNEEEQKELILTAKLVAEEFFDIFNACDMESVGFHYFDSHGLSQRVPDIYENDWHFIMNRYSMYFDSDYNALTGGPHVIAKRVNDEIVVSAKNFVLQSFVNDYDKLKSELLKVLKRHSSDKNNFLSNMRKIQREHNALIELDLEGTIGLKNIEVTRENGRCVGKIDFGGQSIKIITDGNISLVSRESLKQSKGFEKIKQWFKK